MPETGATVELSTGAGNASTARTTVVVFTPAQRARRAAIVFVVGALAAAAMIPIPIIHLLGIPLALVGAVVFAVIQLRTGARIAPVKVPCPQCGAPQLVGGGLGVRAIGQSAERMCDSCRRALSLRVTADAP